ncbi:MAG TPA: PIN domain-containing protein [Acidimicrobiales bacterium]|nr:PIN domain-containing protein [Acidimicrobiales bacterium]
MSLIVDTGVLLAAADEDDADHERCANLLLERRGELKVPAPVVPECAWQIETHLGPLAEARFLGLIITGELEVIDLALIDYTRCAELIETYADLGLGFVDASVVTVAENLDVKTIATLNRRDFSVVRPRHAAAFELVP